jgi:hypothetical protein
LSKVNREGGVNVTKTVTLGAFATVDDMLTDEPLMAVENMAGNDPCELAASTLSKASKIAASMPLLTGSALAGRLKVPNDNVSRVFADISAPKTNSISDDVAGLTREEAMMLAAP